MKKVLFFINLLTVVVCGNKIYAQVAVKTTPHQVDYDNNALSVCDTIDDFTINSFNGFFISRIMLTKRGEIVDFEIFKLKLCSNNNNYYYKGAISRFPYVKKVSEYPDSVKFVYSPIRDLIFNRLCVLIKDSSLIEADTITVVWGRSIGNYK